MFQDKRQKVLLAMEGVLKACSASQQVLYDQSIATEVEAIQHLKSNVESTWPLSYSLKRKITIGVYAAKNLDDWTPTLAGQIMLLDNVLKQDGNDVNKLLADLVATT